MKRQQVQIGKTYLVKVSNQLTQVRIDRENPHGGWDATNLTTGKPVRIKTAARLRGEVTTPESGPSGERRSRRRRREEEIEEILQRARGDDSAAKDPEKGQSNGKKMSLLEAAAQVLQEAGRPMTVREIIAMAEAKGYWTSPGGKTPDRTLYAAIIRDLAARGETSRFRKVERGRFAHA